MFFLIVKGCIKFGIYIWQTVQPLRINLRKKQMFLLFEVDQGELEKVVSLLM